jgi:16S rRNA (guanine1207-N2)-methyltransferase
MPNSFNNPFDNIRLNRFPFKQNHTLRAWDAADELLLSHLSTVEIKLQGKKILIFNDAFGALALSLQEYRPTVISDSLLSQIAIEKNAKSNELDLNIDMINSLSEFSNNYDYLLIKVPKTLDYLRDFLIRIKPYLQLNCEIIVAGMVKNTPNSVWKILEETMGSTSTSLAKKKAKLIFVERDEKISSTPYPSYFMQENTANKIYNHANVFSKQSLDVGTRFLLQNLPQFKNIESIIDLGCGNGIVGLNLAKTYSKAKVTFVDESYMAVASAKLTIENNQEGHNPHEFIVNNSLDGFTSNSIDLIVCNPPFHQSHSLGTHIAENMFQQAYKTLKPKGSFVVVANRHLPYSPLLKKIFGQVIVHANNSKFTIFRMHKSH